MSDSVTLQFRPLYLEDLGTSDSPEQVTTTILGLGDGILVTPLVAASDDTAATNAGLGIGDVYLEDGVIPNRLRANGGSGSGTVIKLTGSISVTVSITIDDGEVYRIPTNISIAGAIVGDPVNIGVNPALPTGVMQFGKVTASGVISIEIWNNSTIPMIPGAGVYTATIVH